MFVFNMFVFTAAANGKDEQRESSVTEPDSGNEQGKIYLQVYHVG